MRGGEVGVTGLESEGGSGGEVVDGGGLIETSGGDRSLREDGGLICEAGLVVVGIITVDKRRSGHGGDAAVALRLLTAKGIVGGLVPALARFG